MQFCCWFGPCPAEMESHKQPLRCTKSKEAYIFARWFVCLGIHVRYIKNSWLNRLVGCFRCAHGQIHTHKPSLAPTYTHTHSRARTQIHWTTISFWILHRIWRKALTDRPNKRTIHFSSSARFVSFVHCICILDHTKQLLHNNTSIFRFSFVLFILRSTLIYSSRSHCVAKDEYANANNKSTTNIVHSRTITITTDR